MDYLIKSIKNFSSLIQKESNKNKPLKLMAEVYLRSTENPNVGILSHRHKPLFFISFRKNFSESISCAVIYKSQKQLYHWVGIEPWMTQSYTIKDWPMLKKQIQSHPSFAFGTQALLDEYFWMFPTKCRNLATVPNWSEKYFEKLHKSRYRSKHFRVFKQLILKGSKELQIKFLAYLFFNSVKSIATNESKSFVLDFFNSRQKGISKSDLQKILRNINKPIWEEIYEPFLKENPQVEKEIKFLVLFGDNKNGKK